MAWPSTQPSLLSKVRDPEDQEAWSAFESRYGDLIVRYCRSRGMQMADAEDVRQIVLLSLSRALRSFHYAPQRGRFRTYLACVVRNAISQLRSRPDSLQIALPFVVNEECNDGAFDDDAWENEWMDHHLRRAMRTVRQSLQVQSTRIFGRLLAGGTPAEVASEFDMTVEGVRKTRQRVRARLKEQITLQIEEEDACD